MLFHCFYVMLVSEAKEYVPMVESWKEIRDNEKGYEIEYAIH